jgi:hypothetical protein
MAGGNDLSKRGATGQKPQSPPTQTETSQENVKERETWAGCTVAGAT